MNDSWKTNYVIDEEEEHKNHDINHPNTLNWAVGETEEYLKEKREGDRLIKPIISFRCKIWNSSKYTFFIYRDIIIKKH